VRNTGWRVDLRREEFRFWKIALIARQSEVIIEVRYLASIGDRLLRVLIFSA